MDDSQQMLSVAKGVFIQQRKKKKPASKSSVEPLYYQHYRSISYTMEQQIQEIERNSYQETFDALVKFINDYSCLKPSEVKELPAAILVMGVNMPDHSKIFHLLEEQLNSNEIFATMKLRSKECSSFSILMQKLVPSIINKYQQVIRAEDVTLKKTDCTLSKLFSYYENLPDPKTYRSPRKSTSKKNTSTMMSLKVKPIVLLLQDVEAFKPDVLQELVLNCNLYLTKLPIILVFGMASAMVTLHNILSQKALSCLGIETFCSFTAIEYLTKIVQQVILSPENSFKFGPKVFRLIVDTVLYHDFSVTNLTYMLKLCMFEHFYENNIASLCCHPSEISKNLQLLTNEQIEKFKNVASLSRFLEKNPSCKASLKNKKDCMAFIEDLLVKHHNYHQQLIVFLNCLHELTKDLPGHPLGKHLREIYPMALEENLTSLSSYQQAMKLLKMHSKDELVSKLQCCVKVLSKVSNPGTEISEMKDSLGDYIEVLQNLTEADYEKEAFVSSSYGLDKITSRSQLQEKLRLTLKTKRSKFEQSRERIVDFITTVFQNLHPPAQLPLHEVLYFDNVLAIKNRLMVAPRVILHRDLVNPHLHLKCSCCKVPDDKEMCSSMPDISILYKLHLECGKLINMYDWLQAFKSVKLGANDAETLDEDTKLNIRFMHAVSELQLLGFIKSTKKKTDHVARLTFGSF